MLAITMNCNCELVRGMRRRRRKAGWKVVRIARRISPILFFVSFFFSSYSGRNAIKLDGIFITDCGILIGIPSQSIISFFFIRVHSSALTAKKSPRFIISFLSLSLYSFFSSPFDTSSNIARIIVIFVSTQVPV